MQTRWPVANSGDVSRLPLPNKAVTVIQSLTHFMEEAEYCDHVVIPGSRAGPDRSRHPCGGSPLCAG